MPSSLSAYRRKIASTSSIKEIVDAMSLVSAAKLRKYEARSVGARSFDMEFSDLYAQLYGLLPEGSFQNLFNENEKAEGRLLIVVTSDLGLCGSYNSGLYRFLSETKKEGDELLVLGKKGKSHLPLEGYRFAKGVPSLPLEPSSEEIASFAAEMRGYFEKRRYKSIEFVRSSYINALSSKPILDPLLPLRAPDYHHKEETGYPPIFEERPEELFEALLPAFLEARIRDVLLESLRSEQSMRRHAMDTAGDNAEELLDNLTIEYNKARQASITREITEVVGGYEAS